MSEDLRVGRIYCLFDEAISWLLRSACITDDAFDDFMVVSEDGR